MKTITAVTIAAILWGSAAASLAEDKDLQIAQDMASCFPVMIHASQVARDNGLEDMATELEGSARGAMVAAEQSLRNGGYSEDYVNASLPDWVETRMTSFKYRNTEGTYFTQEMERCGALNPVQTQLVNQWRSENGKK
jgi:hypothetical protein